MTQPQTHPTLVVTGGELDGTSFIVLRSAKEMLLGSSQDCHFQILLGNVEAVHAKVAWGPKGLLLSDALSSAGTFVNGEKIGEEHLLTDGDRISLGPPGSKSSCKLVVRIPAGAAPARRRARAREAGNGAAGPAAVRGPRSLEPARAHRRPHPRADRGAQRRGRRRPRRRRSPPSRPLRRRSLRVPAGATDASAARDRPLAAPRPAEAHRAGPGGATPSGQARLRDRAAVDRAPEAGAGPCAQAGSPGRPASPPRPSPGPPPGRSRLPLYSWWSPSWWAAASSTWPAPT